MAYKTIFIVLSISVLNFSDDQNNNGPFYLNQNSMAIRILMRVSVLSHFSCVRLCVTLWTAAGQAPLSRGFSRQEDWSGLPSSTPGILVTHGANPPSLMSILHWQEGSSPLAPPGKPPNPQEKKKVKSLRPVRFSATPWAVNPPGSSLHGIFQARVLEWVAISFSRGSS